MTRYKRKISLDKFNSYCDDRTKKSTQFLTETSKPVTGLLWTDSNVLSGNTAFQVRKRCELPTKFKDILAVTAPGDATIISDSRKKYCALITQNLICLYLYNKTHLNIEIPLTDQFETLPFVNIYSTKNKISLSVTSKSGKILYWDNVLESTALSYTLHLRSGDEITTTCTLNHHKVLIVGTRMGDMFPLSLQNDAIQLVPNYNVDPGVISYISSLFIKKPSSMNSPTAEKKECIISIVNVLDTIYVLSEKHIQVWSIGDDLQLELNANISIFNDLIKSISEHIPANMSIENICIEALDIDSKLKNEIVLLSSYQLPVMGDYIQYAASTISIKNVNKNEEAIQFRIKHTTSAPFSTQSKTSSPKLTISKSIAFITFDSHVIAVSRNKKSIFEESVVLNQCDDRVLCVQVEKDGQDGSMESAVIYTIKNGIFDFDIDVHKIQGPEIDGNIYSGYVSNEADSDTNVIQSKLEQAVLFGTSQDAPIGFPLSFENEDISTAVSRVLKELMENTSFLPLSLDVELRAEARYVFVNRIFEVLLENNLRSYVSTDLRLQLMNCAEMCYIAVYLLQEYNGIVNDEPLKQVWFEAIKNISFIEKESDIKEFFSTKANMMEQFLDEALRVCFTDVVAEKDRVDVICKMIDIIMRVLESCRYFKESFSPLYEIEDKDIEKLVYPFNTLVSGFKKTNDYIQSHKQQDNSKLVDRLCDMGEKLLECSNMNTKLEDDVPALVMKGIQSVGKLEFVIELAKKHKYFSTIVDIANNDDNIKKEGDIIKRNSEWMDLYGQPYTSHLFKWLVDHDKEEAILKFDSTYPDEVADFFSKNQLNITWKYYLSHKEYQKCLFSIHYLLISETRLKKIHELLTWSKLITLIVRQSKSSPKDVFKDISVNDISTELEIVNIQIQLVEDFNNHLSCTASTDKLNTILNQYFIKSQMHNDSDLEIFSSAINLLLQGTALEEVLLVFVLTHINGYKTLVDNFITALQLMAHRKHQLRKLSDYLKNKIWKDIYYRDLKIYQTISSADYSSLSLQSIMKSTFTFRILNTVHKNHKLTIDRMIKPEHITFEENEDASKEEEITTDSFKEFINQIEVLATDDNYATLQEMKDIIQL